MGQRSASTLKVALSGYRTKVSEKQHCVSSSSRILRHPRPPSWKSQESPLVPSCHVPPQTSFGHGPFPKAAETEMRRVRFTPAKKKNVVFNPSWQPQSGYLGTPAVIFNRSETCNPPHTPHPTPLRCFSMHRHRGKTSAEPVLHPCLSSTHNSEHGQSRALALKRMEGCVLASGGRVCASNVNSSNKID